MNQTETLRLNADEVRILLTGTAYNMVPKTLDYNKTRVVSATLGAVPASLTTPTDPNVEDDGYGADRETNRQKLADALKKIHDRCDEGNKSFDKTLRTNIAIQTKLLAALDKGTQSFTFTRDETEYLLESARVFVQAEAALTSEIELVVARVQYDPAYPNDAVVSESARQGFAGVVAREEAITCLQAKLIAYRNSLAVPTDLTNDQ